MPYPPERPARAGRIIIPGAEDEPSGSPAPKIVLPPGVTRDEPEALPEYPKLRQLVLVPFSDGKRELLLVSDPLGVVVGQASEDREEVLVVSCERRRLEQVRRAWPFFRDRRAGSYGDLRRRWR